jgi:hypothetical protein
MITKFLVLIVTLASARNDVTTLTDATFEHETKATSG